MLTRLCVLILMAMPIVSSGSQRCVPTPQMHLGGNYEPGSPWRGNIGEGLVVSGQVLSAADCSPVPHAQIDHWQMNRQGRYTPQMRARKKSAEDGGYSFETDWPAAPVPHIHFIVTAPGYKRLVTQWVGDQMTDSIEVDLVLEPVE